MRKDRREQITPSVKLLLPQIVKEKKIGSTTVRLLQGDITTCQVDAVINVTGKTLTPPDLEEPPESTRVLPERACLETPEAGDVPVLVAPSEHLKAEHVMNAPTVSTTATAGALKIRKTMRSIMEEAQAKNLKSLAIPAIGSGINRYPLERCAEILLQELNKSVKAEDNTIEKVIFVLDTQKSYRIFEQALEQFDQDLENE